MIVNEDFEFVALMMVARRGREKIIGLIRAKLESVGHRQVGANVERVLHHIVGTVACDDETCRRIEIHSIDIAYIIFIEGNL